ncbi:MAG: IPT/TIG domain-containing protein [Planctomycetes bacterium]|nr:IPT/TIG domain-containing protein [Planctomycetota bacterium]
MRKAGILCGVVLIVAAFAGVWFTLGPGQAHSTNAPRFADESSCGIGDPLQAGTPVQPAIDNDQPLPAGSMDAGDANDTGEIEPGERPDPSRVEATPGRKPGTQIPGGTGQSESPPDGNEVPVPPPSVPPPPPQPAPFIKGHTRPPGQNLGNTRPGARKIGKPAGIKQLSDVTPKLMQDRRGLYAQYYRMDSPDVTKLDTSTPAMVRIDQTIYFPNAEAFEDLPISRENFAAVWTGFLVIPEQGDYWLFWGADNGGRVELDGETVLLQDGMVRYVEVSTVLTLEPGLHPLKIEFAQAHNAVADWAKCAANFMWVPEGQTKPIPVPPEMLMVPEWMWSDDAPIITSLSKTEGEIGDEITIKGQNLGEPKQIEGSIVSFDQLVTIAGQATEILSQSSTSINVRVPIGAKTGSVIVYYREKHADFPFSTIPSNSVTFTVTTQFGLMAEWRNLEGWANFGREVFESGEPDDSRLESDPGREDPPFAFQVGAVSWTGRIGVPLDAPFSGEIEHEPVIEIWTAAPGRVQVGSQVADLEFLHVTDGKRYHKVRVPLKDTPPCQLDLKIQLILQQDMELPRWSIVYERPVGWKDDPREAGGQMVPNIRKQILSPQFFFPPVAPPEPPVISNVKPVWADGEQSAVPPYDADGSRPSVKVGQEFDFVLIWSLANKARSSPVVVAVDSIPIECTETGNSHHGGGEYQFLRAVMPEGVGEGKLTATVGGAVSRPFFIDITNRGLVAYLYDVPEASGLNELPELDPLACFKVRKDRAINFEDTADFDLPFPAETFVIEWLGGLIIEEEGDYEFICRSDDGMKLWLDDNVVIDANHRQAPAENKATVHLVPGTYRFRMQFFENNQHEVCVLEWRATRGEGEALEEIIPRQVVPAKAYSLDVHPPFPAKTSTGKRTDGS